MLFETEETNLPVMGVCSLRLNREYDAMGDIRERAMPSSAIECESVARGEKSKRKPITK
jgi:hypothetical protein